MVIKSQLTMFTLYEDEHRRVFTDINSPSPTPQTSCIIFLTDTYSSYLLARMTLIWGMRSMQQPSDKHGASVWRLKRQNDRQQCSSVGKYTNKEKTKWAVFWLQFHTWFNEWTRNRTHSFVKTGKQSSSTPVSWILGKCTETTKE